ncbi:FecR family protein [Pararcticibacter amylolyticus]|uniref:Anti-sigma factor n=1 Tax=Pararcticibacter amylolyticus TaxID=2173175 RepID=A0A2U2PC79_9SPHI|nr:FecR family protein [Pararcticibacter amylolyticus]PWG79008.1 hypothetical protein DDR33_19385 [Pararcticibacter amylolyticus]
MKEKIPNQLIDKYLRNECSKEEEEFLLNWYASFEESPDPVESLPEDQQEVLKDRMLGKIRGNLKYDHRIISQEKHSKVRGLYPLVSLAAAAFLIFLVFTFYFSNSRREGNPVFQSNVTLSNRSSSLKKYILPDGSSVWLKKSSSLTFLSKPGDKTREVNLQGECFFDIKQDKLRPFIIHSGELCTRVLGTSFNVKAYGGSRKSEVSVVSGKVFVYVQKNGKQEMPGVTLLSDQKAVYQSGSRNIRKEQEKGSDLKIWEKRSVSFKDEPLSNVTAVLSETFNVKINITDQRFQGYTLNADFTGQSLPVILEMISKSLDVNCEITDNRIVITGNSN